MRAIGPRLSKLEGASREISPAVKQWLGMELTAAERASLSQNRTGDTLDVSQLSSAARKWLGL